MRGKLIVIEGTDCSGKETQTRLLLERLRKNGINVSSLSFPNYDSPTGKIVGGPYLGKDYICNGWFNEGAINVNPKVASLYFAADRKYNMPLIEEQLNSGVNVILDRYIYSNMAHQGSKIDDNKERNNMYSWLEELEFNLLKLPHSDIKIFLHMSYEKSIFLNSKREEKADEHERNGEYLKKSEKAYREVAKKYNFTTIECEKNNQIRSIEDINEELYNVILRQLGVECKTKKL